MMARHDKDQKDQIVFTSNLSKGYTVGTCTLYSGAPFLIAFPDLAHRFALGKLPSLPVR
jgi:hypothetical protein